MLYFLREGSREESVEGDLCAGVGVLIPHEPDGCVMAEINSAQFPYELLDIQVSPQMLKFDCT